MLYNIYNISYLYDKYHFRTLVKGGTVEDSGANGRLVVRIILSDIGFALMRLARN